MLIFIILLHFGLKVLNISAAIADSIGIHICTDFVQTTNTTTVKWAVSSNTPVNISDCELFYSQEGSHDDPAQVISNLPSHGSRKIQTGLGLWTIRVTCILSTSSYPSPEIKLDTGNESSTHICSDSELGSMSPGDTNIIVCIWRPELILDYASVRWQPSFQYTSTQCFLHQEVKGQEKEPMHVRSDDMVNVILGDADLSVWVTCTQQGLSVSSAKAHYMQGDTSACSMETPSSSPSAPDISDGKPTENTPSHGRIGITNIAMGLSLAGGILIVGIGISIGFIRWFRWQRRRRRERLLRHGEPAADQSAMEEFQQMM